MEFGTFDPEEFAEELATAADNHEIGSSVRFENERVRVWDLVLPPGARQPFHCHTRTYFFVTVAGGKAISRFPDGNTVTIDYETGVPFFFELDGTSEIHDLENVGDGTLRFTTVELLES